MNQERRQIIVKEINYWQRNKLLPDHYCDFLLNLYADQDEKQYSDEQSTSIGKALAAVQRASGKQWLLTFASITIISFVVLYFTIFHPALQMTIIILAATAFLWFGQRMHKRGNEASRLTAVGIAMLVLLGGGLYMLELHGLNSWAWKTMLLTICCIFWIIYGIASRIPILHLCGWLTSMLVYAWILSQYMLEPRWYEVQLYWLPAAILFGWASWFVHRWFKPVSAVLFATCAVAWFMPELYSALFLEDKTWLQLQLIGKFALGGGLLFGLRKQWMVWVA